MTPQEAATKLLRSFGRNGEYWCHAPLDIGKACILTGASTLVEFNPDRHKFYDAVRRAAGLRRDGSIASWNDRSDWPTVKAALERVAAGGAT